MSAENCNDVRLLVMCTNFAAEKHKTQRRKNVDKTPYINHPIGVANILSEAGISDVNILCAALLHDTVEDTDTTLEELEKEFGPVIAKIVAEVTDDMSLPSAERKILQVQHARACSHEAKLVKLADKLYNMRDLTKEKPENWTDERISAYYLWSKQVIDEIRGTNPIIEKQLDEIFRREGLIS
ncbi:hypothetical protein LSTR_LSTR006600 [Laodelphax striatellus]|uniref:Guanosine-3',5'-bis(diphosphate) 3'-pyrophosphohydrolase MESH1 n=1 Tax=Laodelphax striatellus TaxID=195883 RepID=A0A482X017_LAOST|nr:hypothetical protein LSTR_LSTR006600 [Laodelphax striatellus]